MSTLHTLAPRVGDAAECLECQMCEGDGFQQELIWRGGWGGGDPEEDEVACFQCAGRGVVVALVCGRCGQGALAHPDVILNDERCCDECGHWAPHYLWLPMREEVQMDLDDEENRSQKKEKSA